MTTDNGISGQFSQKYLSNYGYENPVFDARDRAFLGFQRVTVTRPGDERSPGTQTRTSFATHTCATSPSIPCEKTEDFVYRLGRGLPYLVEVMDEPGTNHLITTVYTYPRTRIFTTAGLDGRLVRRTWKGTTDTYLWGVDQTTSSKPTDVLPNPTDAPDPAGSYVVSVDIPKKTRHFRQTKNFDVLGNLRAITDFGEVDDAGQPLGQPIVTNTEWNLPTGDNSGWNYRPTQKQISYSKGDPQGREVDLTWTAAGLLKTVSSPLSGTLPLNRPSIGAPDPDTASVDSSSNTPLLLRTIDYDFYGNAVRILEPNGRCVGVFYDPTYAQLPFKTTIDGNSACGTGYLSSYQTFDRGLEVTTLKVTPSDEVTVLKYDGFGRIVEIDQPNAAKLGNTAEWPAVQIDYLPAPCPGGDVCSGTDGVRKVHTRTIDGFKTQSYSEHWAYIDGFGRPLASLSEDDTAGSWIVGGLVSRTENGRIAHAYEPTKFTAATGDVFSFDAPRPTHFAEFTYDALGRVLSETSLDKNTTNFRHNALDLPIDIIDPEQVPGGLHDKSFTSFKLDEHGRLARITKNLAKDPIDTILTDFIYSPTGDIIERSETNRSGERVAHRFSYDTLGRMVSSLEPNSTTGGFSPHGWAYAYNDNGDLVGTSDARGCGKNIAYDELGRLLYEDFSPCEVTQSPYSKPNFNSKFYGFGVEKLNIYDRYVGSGSPPINSYLGQLTGTSDLAQTSTFEIDGRGRITHARRKLAFPGIGSVAFSLRHSPTEFEQTIRDYDEANRPIHITTGADIPELLPSGNSQLGLNYTSRGNISQVDSSYGTLLSSQELDASGAVTKQVLGDAAPTTMAASYSDGERLKALSISRKDGPWVSPSATYKPPGVGTPNTLQGILTNLQFSYDRAGNPSTISDSITSQDQVAWPPGAKPVSSKTMSYDDLYHLKSVDLLYAGTGGDDTFMSPILGTDTNFPPVAGAVNNNNRLSGESFTYDWKGNITLADDSDHAPDRSPGKLAYAGEGPHQATSAFQNGTTVHPEYDAARNITSLVVTRSLKILEA
jgi:YD repeat-containing protein